MSKIVIDVEENFHKAVRIAAIESGETMKDFIVRVISEKIKIIKSDNKKTIKKENNKEEN